MVELIRYILVGLRGSGNLRLLLEVLGPGPGGGTPWDLPTISGYFKRFNGID